MKEKYKALKKKLKWLLKERVDLHECINLLEA